MKRIHAICAAVVVLAGCSTLPTLAQKEDGAASADKVAAKPLYRDPVYDGASDPTIIWSPKRKKWYMFYTSRRANVPGLTGGVAWVHGSPIGIATSDDGGATWKYLRNANII